MKDIRKAYFKAAYERVREVKDIMANLDNRSDELNLDNIIDYVVANSCDFYNTYDDSEDSQLEIVEIKNENGKQIIISKDMETGKVFKEDLEESKYKWQIFLPKTKLCTEIIRAYYGDIKDFSEQTWEDIKYYGISVSCANILNKFEKEKKINIIKNH